MRPAIAIVPARKAPFRVLPGFHLSLGFTLFYLALIVLIPLSAVFLKTFTMTWDAFVSAVTSPRVMASYRLTFGASLLAALINVIFGGIVAWVLVRYKFPGKRIIDALVDLPFALPTAVAGIALTTLYSQNGWIGRYLEPLGIKVAFTPLGVLVALTFIGLPFVVRTVQPVLEDAERELEEAAASLGASRWQIFAQVIFPTVFPALLTGFALGLCACHRRIRLGGVHRRQHADGVGNHAAVHHYQAGAIRLHRGHGDCGGDAAGVVRDVVDHQPVASLGAQARPV